MIISFRYPVIIAIVFLSISVASCQSKESEIESIRQTFQQVNNDKTLKTVELENEGFMDEMTDGGGSLKGYFKDDTIRKMHIWVGLSYGVRQFDYYFDKGKLCFVYETESDFPYDEKSGMLNQAKLVSAFEGRYYIHEGKLIDAKLKGHRRFNAETAVESLNDFNSNVISYAKILRKNLKKASH